MCCEKLIEALEAEGKQECFSYSTVAIENGKRFAIERTANQTVCKVSIDGCLIISTTQRKCDYFFRICDTEENFLVELKGTDVIHAVSQILETYKILEAKLRQGAKAYRGFIVSSSVPRAAEQIFRKAQEKSLRDHGVLIKKGHNQMVVSIYILSRN